ncbi:hypothetical protein PLESTB_000032700 [Pleodorina starrii]|uniref:Uncharacterized protein n=1 Tax=Pleodorina starrii TaxID=330485 RepID=A0A9W6B935_9CHLO|nr:hypothetical protein PLESTB_000032700 [Pleodorina starrii]
MSSPPGLNHHPAPASSSSSTLGAASPDGTIHLSPVAVSLSAAVLLVNGFISLRFKLGLHTQLVFASLRMVVQLSLLGYVLVPIFTYDKWWLVLLYGMFMLMIASLEAVQRPSHTFQGVLANTVLAMAASSALLLSYLVLLVLGLRPVWEAQYIIPLLGMLLGNATSAVSVGLSTVLEDLAANRAVIEQLLALGANRFEATDEAVRRALKVSMTPLLNQMSVMGIVSIPGMMTGQILAGGDPTQAARYQMVIMFIIVATTCLASVSSIYLAVLHIVDSTHTFRADRLIRKQPTSANGGAGARWAQAVAAARRGWAAARRKGGALGSCLAAACCCCLCPPPAPRRRPRAAGGSAAAPLLLPPGGGGGGSAAASGGSAASPFAAASKRRWPLWSGRRGGSGAAAATHGSQPDRVFSADSATSSQLLGAADAPADSGGGGGGGGFTSPLSVRSGTGPTATPKLSWDERLLERDDDGGGGGGVYDSEEGGGAAGPGSGQRGPEEQQQQQQQPLLGAAPQVQVQVQGGWGARGSSLVGSSVSTVVAMGGWVGSAASAGWGAVGRWWSGGGAGSAPGPGAGPGSGPGQGGGAGAGPQGKEGYTPL